MGDIIDISDRHTDYLTDKEVQALIKRIDDAVKEFDSIMLR